MQETRQIFYQLADELFCEAGLLANRPSWIKIRQLVQNLPPDFLQNECRAETYMLLLVLLRTPEKSEARLAQLGDVFGAVISKSPSEDFIQLLTQLSPDDLVKSLLPHIYCQDSRGSVAVYIAARAKMHLIPESFQYFLCARTWEQTDLINLAFLVRPSERLAVSTILDQASSQESSYINLETFTEFRHILLEQQPEQPLLPDIMPVSVPLPMQDQGITLNSSESQESQHYRPQDELRPDTQSSAQEFAVRNVKEADHLPASSSFARKTIPTAKSNDNKLSQTLPTIKQHINANQNALFVLFGLTTLFALAAVFSNWLMSEDEQTLNRPINAGKLPPHWTDSATKEKITERYLAADKDYRMGELYLTRDQFSEALILFEDALAIRPEHSQTLYRAAYCRYHLQDYAGARIILRRVIKLDASFPQANLLLARTAAAESDNNTAEVFFKHELELEKNPAVAEEYANFLQNIGKKTEAEYLINQYQALYPDRLLILAKKPEKIDKEQRQ